MAGTAASGKVTPRSLREEARLDLIDASFEHAEIAALIRELAHINRRLANAHRLVTNAADKLDRAYRREAGLEVMEAAA